MKTTKLTAEQAQQIEEALEDLTYEDHDGTIRSGKREDVDVTDTAGKALATIRAARAQEQAEQEPLEDCYKVTYEDGTSCHFGNKRLAEINAGKGDKIEVVKLRALRLVEAAPQPVKQEPVHEALQIASVALQDIACSSQTENLYWWQLRARKAQRQISERLINAAPVRTKDLTDEDKLALWKKWNMTAAQIDAVIAKYKEKNHG